MIIATIIKTEPPARPGYILKSQDLIFAREVGIVFALRARIITLGPRKPVSHKDRWNETAGLHA